MRAVYWSWFALGWLLCIWAYTSLPPGTEDFPVPIKERTYKGPYRWFKHPMYGGTVAVLTGLGGLGGGWPIALAFFMLSELMTREWAWREDR